MPIPAGYTQLTTGFWRKDSDLSGPYAWTGAAFYLISTGVVGSGVAADYTQHPSGFWFKTADGSGPYSYDGTNFWLAGNGGPSGAITVATVNVTSAINMSSGSTFNLYNTADQTTNYERLRAQWSANVAQILSQKAGTGTSRALQIGVSTSGAATTYAADTGGATGIANVFTAANASGTQTAFSVAPTINQSGTAGYIALDINPTETATGSGTKLLQRWAVGGTTQAQVSNLGSIFGAAITACAGGFLGLATGAVSVASADVRLERDAAQTLALRMGTNAQTFRVYNTYTDGSNYERGVILWNSNNFDVLSQSAGTGTARDLRIYTGGASSLYLGSNSSMRFQLNTSGHLLAVADNTYDIGASGANRPRNVYVGSGIVAGGIISTTNYTSALYSIITDGVTAPGATAGQAKLYVDTTDGDLKVIFGDGTIKTIVTDT